LETLRQYAADRLGEADETVASRERHARHFLRFAARIGPGTEDARYEAAHVVLTTELENLRATAEWCIDGSHWAELAEMALSVRRYLYGTAPSDGVAWYGKVIEHGSGVEPRVLVDALGELAWIFATQLGDKPQAFALAERGINLAHEHGLVESPWACLTQADADLNAGRFEEMLSCCEHALAVAESRDDETAASVAIGYAAMAYDRLGDAERGQFMIEEALRRADRLGHRDAIQAAVINASIRYVSSDAPDFAGSLAALERYDRIPRVDDAMGGWLDLMWGASLVGLHRPGGVTRLARTIRLADRLRVLQLEDIALRVLALAAARAGYEIEAATLLGYGDAHLHVLPRESSPLAWLQAALDDVLAGMATRAEHEAAGAASSRGQILALVRHLDATIDHA